MDKEIKMTPQKLFEYITSQMTAEEALVKLLASSLISYQHLRFPEGAGEEVHPLHIIAMAALEMGWQIAVTTPKDATDDDPMEGVVVGTDDYMRMIFKEKGKKDYIEES